MEGSLGDDATYTLYQITNIRVIVCLNISLISNGKTQKIEKNIQGWQILDHLIEKAHLTVHS